MDYKKIYDRLIEKCKVRGLDKSVLEGYFEKHHIVPRCLGGSDEDDNLVLLTGREHFIAHILLWKIYPSVKGLAHAVNIMSNRTYNKLTSRLYEKLKIEVFPRPTLTEGVMFKDKTGMRFGNLQVISLIRWIPKHGNHNLPVWQCLCDCGNYIEVRGNHLTPKGTKSCGCLLSEAIKLAHKSRAPWERTKTKDCWVMADRYFVEWLSLGKPDTSYKFSRLYNKARNTNYSNSYFTTIIKYFNNGWVPPEDTAWVQFKEDYERL